MVILSRGLEGWALSAVTLCHAPEHEYLLEGSFDHPTLVARGGLHSWVPWDYGSQKNGSWQAATPRALCRKQNGEHPTAFL